MTNSVFSIVNPLYKRASNYIIGGNVDDSAHSIINDTYDALCDIEDFHDLCAICAAHINMWNADTFEEQVGQSYEIVEEISGFLGEWLDNN